MHILECEAALSSGSESRLSAEELEYAKEFADNMDTHFTSLVLQHMPANFQKMDRKKAGMSSRVLLLQASTCVLLCV